MPMLLAPRIANDRIVNLRQKSMLESLSVHLHMEFTIRFLRQEEDTPETSHSISAIVFSRHSEILPLTDISRTSIVRAPGKIDAIPRTIHSGEEDETDAMADQDVQASISS
jgi:hypothetical protein